jgi:hypothetical protein
MRRTDCMGQPPGSLVARGRAVGAKRNEPMKIDGACHCGYIRVEGEADPEKTTVCHCTDCQVGTGSAFRVNVPVPGATFRITGQPATYLKTTADERQSTPAGVLSALRLTDLFDIAGGGAAGVLHGTGGNLAPAP